MQRRRVRCLVAHDQQCNRHRHQQQRLLVRRLVPHVVARQLRRRERRQFGECHRIGSLLQQAGQPRVVGGRIGEVGRDLRVHGVEEVLAVGVRAVDGPAHAKLALDRRPLRRGAAQCLPVLGREAGQLAQALRDVDHRASPAQLARRGRHRRAGNGHQRGKQQRGPKRCAWRSEGGTATPERSYPGAQPDPYGDPRWNRASDRVTGAPGRVGLGAQVVVTSRRLPSSL